MIRTRLIVKLGTDISEPDPAVMHALQAYCSLTTLDSMRVYFDTDGVIRAYFDPDEFLTEAADLAQAHMRKIAHNPDCLAEMMSIANHCDLATAQDMVAGYRGG